MAIPLEERKYFEELGEAQVRLQFNGIGFSYPRQNFAREWLAKRDEAHQAEQTWLSKIAAYGSIGAIVVGILGIIVMILLWRFPRH